jgi:hypothetical protein
MLFPEPMSEVELIVPSKDLLAVTKVLGTRGVFHQIDSTYLGLENLGPNTWQEERQLFHAGSPHPGYVQNLNLEDEHSGSSILIRLPNWNPCRLWIALKPK